MSHLPSCRSLTQPLLRWGDSVCAKRCGRDVSSRMKRPNAPWTQCSRSQHRGEAAGRWRKPRVASMCRDGADGHAGAICPSAVCAENGARSRRPCAVRDLSSATGVFLLHVSGFVSSPMQERQRLSQPRLTLSNLHSWRTRRGRERPEGGSNVLLRSVAPPHFFALCCGAVAQLWRPHNEGGEKGRRRRRRRGTAGTTHTGTTASGHTPTLTSKAAANLSISVISQHTGRHSNPIYVR